jgi:hypothetical protein
LPQNTVRSIAQTRDGYLWFATEEGLARFDGARFTVFDRSNPKEPRANNIIALMTGWDGNHAAFSQPSFWEFGFRAISFLTSRGAAD